jgi:hypothetical protein
MTTERNDVLAVMDEMIDCYGSVEECPDDTEFLVAAREARAAVAELIEKADTAEKIIRSCAAAGQIGSGYALHAADLRAALVRVGGA